MSNLKKDLEDFKKTPEGFKKLKHPWALKVLWPSTFAIFIILLFIIISESGDSTNIKRDNFSSSKSDQSLDSNAKIQKIPFCFGYISAKATNKGLESLTTAERTFAAINNKTSEFKIINEMTNDPKIKKHLGSNNNVAEIIKDYPKHKRDIFFSWVHGSNEYKKNQSDDVYLTNIQLFCFS